jgi:hypothetical protein
LFNEPERARQLGAAARERMREQYSIERMVAAYGRLYHEVSESPLESRL